MTEQTRIVTLDTARYEAYLAETELSEAEKQAFLEALWKILVAFVDLGFAVHPVQLACGEIDETLTRALEDMVDSQDADRSKREAGDEPGS